MRRTGLVADGGTQAREQPPHLRGVGHTSGVRQAALVDPRRHHLLSQSQHLIFGHGALQGATKCGGNTRLDQHARKALPAKSNDGAHFLDHGLARLPNIGHGMGSAGRHGNGELVHARLQRRLGSAQVGHQRHDRDPTVGQRVAHHGVCVCHLRQQASRHEGGDFNFTQTAGDQGINPAQFGRSWHGGRHRLQAIARPHFADQHCWSGA